MSFIPAEIIHKKRFGEENTAEEISFLINSYVKDEIPDYQMSAWIMAICFQGMTPKETATLTALMRDSGERLDLEYLNKPRIDKHSTGGVGDKASLILAPIAASCGVTIPMVAGRGLGHTGGTIDKLKSINGFKTEFTIAEFTKKIEHSGFALMGQTEKFCPADRKLYALRDVTATIDSLPLICASIMSKKLAENLTGLVLDIKFGSGAFMKTLADAEELALLLKDTGELNGVEVTALLTNMNQPLGRYIGNNLEIKECIEILKGKTSFHEGIDLYKDTRELSLQLAAHMILLAKLAHSPHEAYQMALEHLTSGQAYERFLKFCHEQGGSNPEDYTPAKEQKEVLATQDGFIVQLDTEQIGWASLELGAGRKTKEDVIDNTAGIEWLVKTSRKIKKGEPIAILHATNKIDQLNKAYDMILEAITWGDRPHDETPLVAKVIY